MAMNPVKKIALVGIDGAGKSTIMRRFLELAPVRPHDVMALTCPQYHDTPNAPLATLSEAMDAYSRASDELGSFELKASALFLQMTLYGPIEKFLLDTYQPRILINERHPIVDTLAYGPFYGFMIKDVPDANHYQPILSDKISAVSPAGLDAILHWQQMQNARLGQDLSVWNLPVYVRELFKQSPEHIVAELQRQYRAELPDVVILLDPGIEVALARIKERSAGAEKELHEQAESLGHLRHSYQQVLKVLKVLSPAIQTHVIDTGNGDDIDATLQRVIDCLELQ